jgi:hypothetical protein
MRGGSVWLVLVVLLLGIVLLREPRFAQAEDVFLCWLLEHSSGTDDPPVPLTVVDIAQGSFADAQPTETQEQKNARSGSLSPLEFALFLQAVLDFQPSLVAFENILKWRERDKDQEQVFLDQAMRVPKLVLAAELGDTTDPDAPWADIRGFPNVTGKRGDLAPFSGIARQPNEDLRLISTQGFINLPDDLSSNIRVPLLFLYRGEVIPSFALQAVMLWLRITPAEVRIVLGSHIELPQNRRIPIASDGTMLFDPNAAKRARRLTLNELLLAAQQRDTANPAASPLADLRDQIVLARMPENPLSPPDVFAATIATIQSNTYLRRVSRVFDCVAVVLIAAAAGVVRRLARFDLVLLGLAITAAYCLIALGVVARWGLWLPGVLPLSALWITIIAGFFLGKEEPAREPTIAAPSPVP